MTDESMSPEEAALRRRLHDAREEERVRGEQAWQLASPPFAFGLIAPVWMPAGWRMPSFIAGMVLAAGIWGWFKLKAARAARAAETLEDELLDMGAALEPGDRPEEAGAM